MPLAKIIDSNIYCIHHLFEEQVRNTPEAIAVTCDKQKLNYYELNQMGNQLAYCLAKYVITPNTQVAICARPSLDMFVGLLGILKAGGTCVSLLPDYSKDRLTDLLNQADINIILTQRKLKDRFTINNYQVICLDSGTEWLDHRPINNPISPTEPANLACVNYTFESNRFLKATGLSHKTVIAQIQQQLKYSNDSSRSKTLRFNPASTATSIQELFATWFSGGNLILALEKLLLTQ